MHFSPSPLEYRCRHPTPIVQLAFVKACLLLHQQFNLPPTSSLPILPQSAFDRFVETLIKGLTQVSSSRENVQNLNPKGLNLIPDCSHHMDAIRIKYQDWNTARWLCHLPWDEHSVDPTVHHLLIHSSLVGNCSDRHPDK